LPDADLAARYPWISLSPVPAPAPLALTHAPVPPPAAGDAVVLPLDAAAIARSAANGGWLELVVQGALGELRWPQRCACCDEPKLVVSNIIHPATTETGGLYCDLCNEHIELAGTARKMSSGLSWGLVALGGATLLLLVALPAALHLPKAALHAPQLLATTSLLMAAAVLGLSARNSLMLAAARRRMKPGCRDLDSVVQPRWDASGQRVVACRDRAYADELAARNGPATG
jgi:hypothetical protein